MQHVGAPSGPISRAVQRAVSDRKFRGILHGRMVHNFALSRQEDLTFFRESLFNVTDKDTYQAPNSAEKLVK